MGPVCQSCRKNNLKDCTSHHGNCVLAPCKSCGHDGHRAFGFPKDHRDYVYMTCTVEGCECPEHVEMSEYKSYDY